MQTNRRSWLKQMGLGVAAVGFSQLDSIAAPVKDLLPYTADDLPIKLSSNENPYGPSPMARRAMAEYINSSNRYNWPLTAELLKGISKKNGVSDDNIMMGAGSTEILDLVARVAALEKGEMVIADPSYSYWTGTAEKAGLKKISVPLTADKKLDLAAMLKAITPDTRLVYVCNPNNPTGTICAHEALIQFIQEATKRAIVLVDEAYIDFTDHSSLSPLVLENKNLIVAKTFSKIYGLAGARVGYAVAHADTLEHMSELQSWVNGSISVISTAAAIASLKDEKFVSETYVSNAKARLYTIEQLQLLGLKCIPSHTNFIYFSLEKYKGDFFQRLKDNNILGTKIYEEQGTWTRITIGTMQEMQKFIQAIS